MGVDPAAARSGGARPCRRESERVLKGNDDGGYESEKNRAS